ncbi:MAG: hypothetical protein AAF579_19340 [Cyanobacteria bacterium P01_C01_bin.118]
MVTISQTTSAFLSNGVEDKSLYGDKYVLFPNPTDGHWIAGIFGESEPPATDENRAILKSAASMRSWDGE